MDAIEVKNVTKKFKIYYDKASTLKEKLVFWNKKSSEVRTVLEDISIKIKKGETVALIGTNGSGKSTLLKLMTKIIYPTSGKVITHGKLTSLLELGAGFHPDFTGRENIYFILSYFIKEYSRSKYVCSSLSAVTFHSGISSRFGK